LCHAKPACRTRAAKPIPAAAVVAEPVVAVVEAVPAKPIVVEPEPVAIVEPVREGRRERLRRFPGYGW
jgi:hypothetical protein